MSTRDDKRYMSVEEVARELRVTRRHIYQLLRQGELKGLKQEEEGVKVWKVDRHSLGFLLEETLSEERKVIIQMMADRFLNEASRDGRITVKDL